jgi:hypothetical protein
MSQFEENLKRALQRVDPPAGFAERVLARAAEADREKPKSVPLWARFFGMGGLRWAAACAVCVVLAASGALYEHDVQRRRGEAAKEQLMLALRITGSKLQIAQQSLQQLGTLSHQER